MTTTDRPIPTGNPIVELRRVPAWAYAEEKELAPLQEFADQQRLPTSLLCSPCAKDHHEFCRASDPALKAHCDCGCH